jgi:hypothetical protein
MTEKEKTKYMRIALSLLNIGLREKDVAKVIAIYEMIGEKKGSVSLRDLAAIEVSMDKKYKQEII